jgi:PKD repeat protein
VFVDGEPLLFVLDMTITRGLDQDMATAEIIYPHPLPDVVRQWSKVQILAGAGTYYVERFVGYIVGVDMALWPGAKTIRCQDVLAIAANKFTPEEQDLHDMTDQFAVREVLFDCGYHEGTFSPINGDTPGSGTGVLLADVEEAQLFWELGQSGLECIQGIDSISLGWRTYATAGGKIVRTLINTDPNTTQTVHDFAEGVDIIDGSASMEILDPRNEITVTGFDGSVVVTLDPEDDPFHWSRNSYWIRFMALRTQVISAGVLNPEDVAAYILSQIGKPLISVTFSTHLDIPFVGQEVVKLTSERLEVDQNFWVQSVQLSITPEGQFVQTITGISALQPQNRHMVTPPIDVGGVEGIEPGGDIPGLELPTAVVPADTDVLADFTIVGIDRETAELPSNPTGTGTSYYIVTCSDTSSSRTGLITAWAWSATGTGVTITSGSEQTFTTAFTDLEGAEITLTVTDSNGSTASVTHSPNDAAVPVRSRTLFACSDTEMYANDGTEWRKQAPSGASTVQCVANGPMWGCGALVAISEDYLATAATEVSVFSGGDVSSIWISESNSLFAAAGSDSGEVSVTRDRGVTWEARTSPGSVVKFIIVSIHDSSELHVVTPEGWFKSQDEGETWESVRAGDFTYLELSHSRNIIVTAAGALEKAEDGTPFTGITGTVVAATAHIREDRFYALTSDGNTWVQDTDGSFAMVAGEPIPDGEPYHAGTYRDGLMIDLVYFAAQDGGLWKTLDGFTSANGYLRILRDGMITP